MITSMKQKHKARIDKMIDFDNVIKGVVLGSLLLSTLSMAFGG